MPSSVVRTRAEGRKEAAGWQVAIAALAIRPQLKHLCSMPVLFSYGTLREEAVQLSTFGRRLQGHADELVGFEQASVRIEDPRFVAKSGKSEHAIIRFTGRSESRVAGTAFEVSEEELAKADRYEPAGYRRISTTLASCKQAWVYADARFSSATPWPA